VWLSQVVEAKRRQSVAGETGIEHFVGNTEQSDDLTLLAISYKP